MDISEKLEEIFRHFPGIGPRQAKRFVYHLLTKSQSELEDFSTLLSTLKGTVFICPSCHRFHTQKSVDDLCNICRDNSRNKAQLLIVPRDIDVQAIEKSRAYHGLYFVLGGTIPILDTEPEKRIRQAELLHTLQERNLDEIIIATSINPESEYTATYLISLFKKQFEHKEQKPKVTTLGRGLSTGTELEYSDADTLRSALENRR